MFQFELGENPRQPDLLGYSRHLGVDQKTAPSAVSRLAAGQFDDAEDEEEFVTSVNVNKAGNGNSSGLAVQTDGAAVQHRLQWLAEAACGQKELSQDDANVASTTTKTASSRPKRVSLSPGHCTKEVNKAKLQGPRLPFLPVMEPQARITPVEVSPGESKETLSLESVHPISRGSSTSSVASVRTVPGPTVIQLRKTFEEHFKELVSFGERYGHVQVPTRGEHKSLGRWLSTQRCKFRDGDMSYDNAKRLRELGCTGFVNDGVENRPPPVSMKDKNVGNKSAEEPSKEKSENQWAAKSIIEGFVSGKKNAGLHDGRVLYHRHHGPPRGKFHPAGTRIPSSRMGPPSHQLVPWNGMPAKPSFRPMPMHSFHQSPYPMAARPSPNNDDPLWNYWLQQLGAFKHQFGHTNVSTTSETTSMKDHEDLSLWLASQRHMHRKGQLHPERANLLHAHFGCHGFEPSTAPEQPNPVKDEVIPKALDGKATPPQQFRSHSVLPVMVSNAVVRTAPPPSINRSMSGHKKRLMHSAEAIHSHLHGGQNKEVGQTNAAPKPARKRGQYMGWHDRLKQLMEFKRKNGHCEVRIMMNDDCKELGRWLASQRHQFRKGKLPQDKVDILERTGVNLAFKKSAPEKSLLSSKM